MALELIALVPAAFFCSAETGRCMTVYAERVEPVFEACEAAMIRVFEEKASLEAAAKLPKGLYLVHKECIAVFK